MSYLILVASWIIVVLSNDDGYKTCQSTIRNIEGDVETYYCESKKECCATEEEPNKCCLPDMEKGIIPLKMLLLYLLLGVVVLLILILIVYGCYRALRKRRSNSQDKVELDQAVDSLDRYRARRYDNYGDEVLEPPPYDQKPPPEYQFHGHRTTLPSAPPPHHM